MKKIFGIFLFLLLSASSYAQVVSVDIPNSKLKLAEKIVFNIVCASEQDLEITLFNNNCLISQQKATLIAGTHPFEIPNIDCESGSYFLLVTGNGIHVEKEFTISK